MSENNSLTKQKLLDEQIMSSRKEIRADRLDMSFGELMNMYMQDEIIISPEFQRAFRWTKDTQSKFIESILLGIPIPPIFVAETSDNIWELVDGLQRLSTIFSFFGILKDENKNNLVLEEGSILTELKGFSIKNIPINYKLLLKRAVCRIEVIRFDSEFDMRYELFNRLNTGGAKLSEQEIRNCIFRVHDNTFNAFLNRLSEDSVFQENIVIKQDEKETMYYQELVLRYFTLKNKGAKFETNIQRHMDKYMLEISKGESEFEYNREEEVFNRINKLLQAQDENVFKLGTLNFSTSMYDSLMISFAKYIDYLEGLTKEEVKARIENLKNDSRFRQNTGASSSSRYRLNLKIELAEEFFSPKE